ncbi:MAG: hypothetical protein PUC23_00535, partial [bacterium]|nr:hypothetical protein [bacterium]
MRKEKFNDVREWLPIKNVEKGINLKNGNILKILEVKPINFKLLSENEQYAILEGYKNFFKQCNFEMQIVIQAFKTDINKHLNDIEKYSYGNSDLSSILMNYTELIKNIINDKKSITRRFFIILNVDSNINDKVEKVINVLRV